MFLFLRIFSKLYFVSSYCEHYGTDHPCLKVEGLRGSLMNAHNLALMCKGNHYIDLAAASYYMVAPKNVVNPFPFSTFKRCQQFYRIFIIQVVTIIFFYSSDNVFSSTNYYVVGILETFLQSSKR